jgi:putative flippase GtrA
MNPVIIPRQIIVFLIVGTLTATIDFVTYRGLVWAQVLSVDWAKAVGFFLGTVAAYFANHYWTFGAHSHGHRRWLRFVVLYAISIWINVYMNAVMLATMDGAALRVYIAFVIATAFSACMNFLGLKFFVFAHARPRRASLID